MKKNVQYLFFVIFVIGSVYGMETKLFAEENADKLFGKKTYPYVVKSEKPGGQLFFFVYGKDKNGKQTTGEVQQVPIGQLPTILQFETKNVVFFVSDKIHTEANITTPGELGITLSSLNRNATNGFVAYDCGSDDVSDDKYYSIVTDGEKAEKDSNGIDKKFTQTLRFSKLNNGGNLLDNKDNQQEALLESIRDAIQKGENGVSQLDFITKVEDYDKLKKAQENPQGFTGAPLKVVVLTPSELTNTSANITVQEPINVSVSEASISK